MTRTFTDVPDAFSADTSLVLIKFVKISAADVGISGQVKRGSFCSQMPYLFFIVSR